MQYRYQVVRKLKKNLDSQRHALWLDYRSSDFKDWSKDSRHWLRSAIYAFYCEL